MDTVVTVAYFSDLHIELLGDRGIDINKLVPQDANILCLCGDIGKPSEPSFKKFLEQVSEKFEHIYFVAGNHEFYDSEYFSTKRLIKKVCNSFPNVHYLNSESHVYKGSIRFIGATLWSYIPLSASIACTNGISDYKRIRIKKGGRPLEYITIQDTNKWHQEQLDFIEQEVNKAEQAGQQVVILTHHAPLNRGTSHPSFENSSNRSYNHAFATELSKSNVFKSTIVKAWLFGHTHYSSRQEINGILVASNQLGYPHESNNDVTNFDQHGSKFQIYLCKYEQ